VVLAAASNASFMNSLNAAALALRPFTVVRSRGFLHVKSDQTGALEDWNVALGYSIVSDQASAIGITALPTPDTDRGSDLFFVFEDLAGSFVFVSGVGFDSEGGIFKDWDSKAMRKVEEGQDLVITSEAGAISAGLTITHGARILIKLH